ncbi:MAG: tRNA (5-methylaminomethyl-2-thiouridine)(34)-methyltransferase MnmD [Balneolaceae bacterium]
MNNSSEYHISKDGSSTLYSNQFGQYYHNPNGAISESKLVFFETSKLTDALLSKSDHLGIFEVGFGTGLNFLLLLDYYLTNNISIPIHFYSVEAFPIDQKTVSKLNFYDFLTNKDLSDVLPNIFKELKPGKNTFQPLHDIEVKIHLYYCSFDEISSIEHPIDFVFHDAFSPEVNDELWRVSTFEKLALFCNEDAILATYCAASKARAAMAKAGWFVRRAPGALGKREMTIASLSHIKLTHLKRVNERRLIERWNTGEFEKTKSTDD